MASARKGQRAAERKQTTPILVSHLSSMRDFAKIARTCEVVEASTSGLLLHVRRENLVPQILRKNLTLDCLLGDHIYMRLEDMNLEISGIVARTQLLGKAGFLIAVDYSADAPEYWRECLTDLLPQPGEID